MRNFIGHIHDTRNLTTQQIDEAKRKIKAMLHLDTIDIGNANGEFYPVSTDDSNILDFKFDNYDNDKISFVKYKSYIDQMKRDDAGATLTSSDIKCKE
jgi:hypothetical protein